MALYSERLTYGSGSTGSWELHVPEKKRAIIRSVAVLNSGSDEGTFFALLHGFVFLKVVLPAGDSAYHDGLAHVVYEREQIRMQYYGNDVHFYVSGYLFDDPIGRTTDPPTYTPGRLGELPDVLPAGAT